MLQCCCNVFIIYYFALFLFYSETIIANCEKPNMAGNKKRGEIKE